jgi:hypothetical protein
LSPPPAQPDPALLPVQDDPALPRVLLLIGDSISIGYTLPLRELLKGKANVPRPLVNCWDTARGIVQLDQWLGHKEWDVIHFNFGLHDLKYLDETGTYTSSERGRQVAPPAQYEQNLRQLVARLKRTRARLIWASITPIPDGSTGRVRGDDIKYNEVAARVMTENGIAINDLYARGKLLREPDPAPSQCPFHR